MGMSNQIPSSRLIQPGVIANASERPASPYEGQCIFETDTDRVLYWNGSAWYPAWNRAWGIVGGSKLGTTFTTSATHTVAQDTGLTTTINAVSGRLYRITVAGNYYPVGGVQTMVTNVVWNGTEIVRYNLAPNALEAGNSLALTNVFYYQATSTASVVVKTQLRAGASNAAVADYGSTGANQYRVLLIEDIGPA